MEEREWKSREGLFLLAREMVEVVLGLGAAFCLGWWLPDAWRPSHVVFCAFFVVVFAIAIRYHILVAYSASSLAAVSYGLLLWLHPALRVEPAFFSLALEPFLLLISGVLASDLLHGQRQRLTLLEQKYACADEALQAIQGRYQGLLKNNELLEQQIAGLPTSIATLSEKMTRLWRLTDGERCSALVDLINCALEAQSCAFYTKLHDSWQLRADHSSDGSVHPAVLDMGDPLIRRVLEQRKVCTIHDLQADEKSAALESAVLAGPLLDEAGAIMGIVSIDALPLLRFTPGTTRIFSALLALLSFAWQTGARPEREEDQQLADPQPDPEAMERFAYTRRTLYQLAVQAELDAEATDPALPKLQNT